MQTFLSEQTIVECAQALDSKRLNKQILESYQILNVLSDNSPTGGWKNHPAVLMWKNHEYHLYQYAKTMIAEAKSRGIKVDKNEHNIDTLKLKFETKWGKSIPYWLSSPTFDRIVTTHRANLYRKDPIYYSHYSPFVKHKLNKPCCEKCQYFWVTHKEKNDSK
ncbi:hypothetical protein EBQ93_00690 [bacterium]|nr:hypothetical protein [bacterium]